MRIPETVEELLAAMVSFNTINPQYSGTIHGEIHLVEYLEKLAVAWGLRSQRFPVPDKTDSCNLLISYEPVAGAEWLLFESHLDTVSANGMTIPAFELGITDTRLCGRGACDTKGSGAAMLWAMRHAKQNAFTGCNVGVLFSSDEEAGMTGAAAFTKNVLPDWKASLAGIIVGEPTLLRPVAGHNGVVRWTTITRGRAAHSSDPSKGRSAISAMVQVIDRLESELIPKISNRHHPLTGSAACSINVIRGGTQVNIIPERCEIEVDRRLIPGETVASALAERDQTLSVLALNSIEHTAPYSIPPLVPEPNLAFLSRIAPAFERNGIKCSPNGAPYVTNASHYASAGVPTIVLGPGDIAQAHTADEWLGRDQLRLAVALYTDILTSVARG